MKNFCFVSGLPRSGSTLFMCLMNQHQNIYATATSPTIQMLLRLSDFYNEREEFRAWEKGLSDKVYKGMLAGAINGFYENVTNKPLILDKSRDAIFYLPLVRLCLPDSKFIFIARDLQCICNSYEKKFTQNISLYGKLNKELLCNKEARYMAYTRSPELQTMIQFIRHFDFENDKSVLVIKGEDFTSSPQDIAKKVTNFLGLEKFTFDINNVEQIYENDLAYSNFVADHKIKRKIEKIDCSINKDMDKVLKEAYPWYYSKLNY